MTSRYRLPDLEPLALLQVDPSTCPPKPQQAWLCYNPDDGEVWVDLTCACDGTPEAYWHGRLLRWPLAPTVDASVLAESLNAGELDEWLDRLHAEHEVVWDGSNRLGRLSPAGEAAARQVETWLDQLAGTLSGGLVQAADWLAQDQSALREQLRRGVDLATLATELEAEARAEGYVLVGTESYLQRQAERLDVRP